MNTGDHKLGRGDDRTRMNPWTLRFTDADAEAAFTQKWYRANRFGNAIWFVAGVSFYFAYTAVLWWLIPADEQQFMDLRILIGFPSSLVSALPLLLPVRYSRFANAAFLIGMLMAFLLTTIQAVSHAAPHHLLFLLEMAMIFGHALQCNRIKWLTALQFSVLAVLVMLPVLYLTGPNDLTDQIPAIPFWMSVAGMAIAGISSAFTREYFVRRNFISIRALRSENERAEEMTRKATAASDSKSRFLAIVSHELRTPLNAVLGYSEMLKLGVVGDLQPPKASGYVNNIHESGQHLLALVNDVLDFTRTGAKGVDLVDEPIDLKELMNDVMHAAASRPGAVGIRIAAQFPDDLPALKADPVLVRKCLAHLFSNAVKFSGIGGSISCGAEVGADGDIHLTVSDRGSGISADKMANIFDPFEQEDDGLDRHHEGLGIGLPLTRSLMLAHGGDVRINSLPNVGTVATLVFPSDRTVVRGAPATRAEPARTVAA